MLYWTSRCPASARLYESLPSPTPTRSKMIDLANPSDVRREAERRQRLRAQGARTFGEEAGAIIHQTDSVVLVERPKAARTMNKTEGRRAVELNALLRAGDIQSWAYEAITLKLAEDCRYTPDFFVVETSGRIRFEETKGFWRDDARVKIKVAAKQFPMFSFVALTARKARDGGGWKTEEF
jgi:hypothetical protein